MQINLLLYFCNQIRITFNDGLVQLQFQHSMDNFELQGPVTNLPRRSRRERRSKEELEKEKNVHIKSRLEMDNDVGLGIEVAYIENKGRGVKVRLGQLDLRLFYLLF